MSNSTVSSVSPRYANHSHDLSVEPTHVPGIHRIWMNWVEAAGPMWGSRDPVRKSRGHRRSDCPVDGCAKGHLCKWRPWPICQTPATMATGVPKRSLEEDEPIEYATEYAIEYAIVSHEQRTTRTPYCARCTGCRIRWLKMRPSPRALLRLRFFFHISASKWYYEHQISLVGRCW